ncbi:MAG: UbiX family flavin prenyltransferase [Proteobacteria bacterium]|nr:UbiX family flavin prenyltransferase [Pseudomonadota bacterium]
MRLIVGIAGASGVIYGIRLLEVLKEIEHVETHLILSQAGRMNISIETDWKPAQVEALADQVHKVTNLAASLASGSFKTAGMVVTACSMKTLSAIVHSHADDLMTRAADVTLKEGRRLVLMPRETPLHRGHCKLFYEASKLGAIIAPPMPALYARPQSIDQMVDHTVGRILDLFGIEVDITYRWQGAKG